MVAVGAISDFFGKVGVVRPMMEEHQKLQEQIEFLVRLFESETRMRCEEIRIQRDWNSNVGQATLAIQIPVTIDTGRRGA